LLRIWRSQLISVPMQFSVQRASERVRIQLARAWFLSFSIGCGHAYRQIGGLQLHGREHRVTTGRSLHTNTDPGHNTSITNCTGCCTL
jgi:hypothetical protein